MASAPLVSVVIPNHNYAHYVGAAIDSVLAQTHPNVEVVVVDNGSTDGSLETLRAYEDRCRIVAQDNLGQSGGRNRGILESNGAFIAFLDADDVWLPTKLEAQLACFAQRPRTGLVYCGLIETNAALVSTGTVEPLFRGDVLDAFAAHPGRAIVVGGESTAVVRREALARVGLFEPTLSISAGWDLWRRIATYFEVDFVASSLVRYRQHGSNMHDRLAEYEYDVRRASKRFFEDDDARRVHDRRSRYFSRLDLMFAKSWARAHRPRRAVALAMRAAVRAPIAVLSP